MWMSLLIKTKCVFSERGQDDSLFLSGPRFAQAIVSEKNLKL